MTTTLGERIAEYALKEKAKYALNYQANNYRHFNMLFDGENHPTD